MRSIVGLVSLVALAACHSGGTSNEQTSQSSSAVFANGNFETGSAGAAPPSWTVTPYLNPGVTIVTPQTRDKLNLATGGNALTKLLVTAAGPESQADASLGTGASLRWPKYGNQVALVNQNGASNNTNSLSQTMTITSADIDPSDAKIHVRFVVAPVLENPGHPANQQPYYFVQLSNLTRSSTLYRDYNASAQPGVPWKTSNGYYYTDWQLVDISPGTAQLAVGDQVQLEVIAAGCSQGGHFGEVYVDGVGSTIPGIFVSGVGPASANDGSDITYTLTYQNGGTTSITGTSVTFNTPTGTTFKSVSAPGLTCSTPAVGGAGAVSCAVGNFAASASGTLQVTVNINSGVTGTLTAGNYSIGATAVSPLVGPKVYTNVSHGIAYSDVGLTVTDNATGVQWGQPITYTIVASNPSGPNAVTGATVTDTFPSTLTNVSWTCAGSAGGSCAAAGVGNIADATVNLPVGASVTYTVAANVVAGSGGGQVANTASIALGSGGSDPDATNNAAGVYNTITSPNGTTCATAADCTSGVCDAAGKICIPTGGCGADSDCATTAWCNTQTFACVAKLANNVAMPTVGGHSPTLTGTCTTAAGASVCTSGVCDTSNDECGYAAGGGVCSAANGATVCQSGICSVVGTCNPVGGCQADGDCTAGNWCNETTQQCTPKIANGSPLPTDAAHTSPILDGHCSSAAAAAACQSGVCDSDDNCGYANGAGSCSSTTATTVCRSGACDGTDGKCGYANGAGPCSGNGALCRSNVCESDGNCGYQNGDGPCSSSDATTVCRSGICATSGLMASKCEECASDTNCSAPSPACDIASGTCKTCTATNATACGGSTPLCDTASAACTACKVDNGASGGFACPNAASPYCVQSGAGAGSCTTCTTNAQCEGTHAGPICDLATGACGTVCAVDADCGNASWCDSGTCTSKIANGQMLPTSAPINATCSPTNGARVCTSGVCGADNRCGYSDGGSCSSEGASVCRSNVCAAGGANAGTCVGCNGDDNCAMPQPACDGATNACVECSATNASACTGATPSCDVTQEKCVACGGDYGSASAVACSSAQAPFCDPTGACGLCTTSNDCSGDHAGPICDTVTGACGTSCRSDEDCGDASKWCNAAPSSTGTCVPKLGNGVRLPASPSSVASCNGTVGARVCASGVCDPSDDKCGLALKDGPCSDDSDCRFGACVMTKCQLVLDGGALSDAGVDSGSTDPGHEDGGVEATDAGSHHSGNDAGTVALDTGASVEGGGLTCAASPGHAAEGASFYGVLTILGFGLRRRRRAGRNEVKEPTLPS